jgi:hypothetical protein
VRFRAPFHLIGSTPLTMIYFLDHKQGMFAINFPDVFLVHTKNHWPTNELLNWHPINNLLFIMFCLVNSETKLRRINFVYDAVARKTEKPRFCPFGFVPSIFGW